MSENAARGEVSAGGVVIRIDGGEPHFLIIRDSYQNWGFPKGHVEDGEAIDAAARREVTEETGITDLVIRHPIGQIDWHFRFRGQLVHKVCHFFLMETAAEFTSPQRAEGITACQWARFDDAEALVSYANAREVLRRAQEMIEQSSASA